MTFTRLRTIVASALVVVAALAVALPAIGATSNGSITIDSPQSRTAVRGDSPVEWSWKSGTYVKSTSKVDVSLSLNSVIWTPLARSVPIRAGETPWNTRMWRDGIYYVRVQVVGTTIRSQRTGVVVDNTNPTVEITRPKEGEIIVEDTTMARFAVVSGRATAAADAADAMSGLARVVWKLDDTVIGEGKEMSFDYGSFPPGEHTLSATAFDRAGNNLTDSIQIYTVPGPRAPDTGPTPTPTADPSAIPTAAPSSVPTPDPSALPSVSPSQAPSPGPSALPSLGPEAIPTALPST